MKDCISTSADNLPLDPNKRVNYAFGMVLGVNDFRQEQTHFEWKQRLSNRLLHGMGTVCGLKLSTRPLSNGSDVEVYVTPGYGISPQGHWIWVEHEQCGRFNQWLQGAPPNVASPPLSPPDLQKVYVTLCYDQCLTDPVPVAGRACASDEDTRVPSRLLETFKLQFSWQAPKQTAEDAARDFEKLLGQVRIVPPSSLPDADDSTLLLERVAVIGTISASPSSPPITEIHLSANTACATLQQALTVWVTEVCPRLESVTEDCLLLGGIDFDLDANGVLIPESVSIDERNRPVLVADRIKQALFCLIGRDNFFGQQG